MQGFRVSFSGLVPRRGEGCARGSLFSLEKRRSNGMDFAPMTGGCKGFDGGMEAGPAGGGA